MTRENAGGGDLSRIEGEAVEWAQKLASGDATPGEIEAARQWRARDAEHEAAFQEADRVWREIGAAHAALSDPKADYAAMLDALGRRRKTVNRRVLLGGGVTAVAAVAVYGVVRPPLGLWPSLSQLNADYRTGTGEQRSVSLEGDISINLNTQTSLAIRAATAAEERIELIAGEASFTTSGRGMRTLAVLAADGRTVTEAGRFDIRYTEGEGLPVTVTCFDGKVRIERGDNVAELGGGQQVRYNASGISGVAAVDPAAESAWQRGIVEFRNTPIVEVVAEINRYRPGRIVLMSTSLAQKHINGRFRIGEMDEVLVQLQQAVDAKLRYLPGGLVLLS